MLKTPSKYPQDILETELLYIFLISLDVMIFLNIVLLCNGRDLKIYFKKIFFKKIFLILIYSNKLKTRSNYPQDI